jgi:hypothetical protein
VTPTNATDGSFRRRTFNQSVARPLMIPFTMIMGNKLSDEPPKMALAERNDVIQIFLLD